MKEFPGAVIFDMDGLMLDSEPLQFDAFRQMLWSDFRVTLADEDVHQMVGLRIDDNWRYLKATYNLPGLVDELVQRRDEVYRPILENNAAVAVLPGVQDLIASLIAAGYSLALASSSPYWQINIVLDALGMRPAFAAFASGEEVVESKPNPEIYLLALRRLEEAVGHSIPAARGVALEDSGPGILAAKRAGLAAIAIPNDYTRTHDFSPADRQFLSLADPDVLSAIRRLTSGR